jgi:hypothetical protein
MSFLKKLFGGGSDDAGASGKPGGPSEEYKGFSIAPSPMAEGGQYRLRAIITKDVDGDEKSHDLIRADIFSDKDMASSAAVAKAKQMIDEQGERIFAL